MRIILGTYFIIITIIIIIVYSTWSKNRTFSKVYFDFKDKKQDSLLLIIITNNKVTARMKQPPFTSVAKLGLKKYRINSNQLNKFILNYNYNGIYKTLFS